MQGIKPISIIKMKKTNLIINLTAIVFLLLMILVFFWQFNTTASLRRELSEKKKELKAIKTASRRLEELAKKSQELKEKEESSYKKIPLNEKQPFGLMKILMRLGGEIGLREINFSIKNAPLENQVNSSPASEMVSPEGLDSATDQTVQGAPILKPKPVGIQMECEGTFFHLLTFLERVLDLERLVSVEQITIERKENILPYQEISLEIVTYTY